ncbi:MAG: M15 family metallopeptidase [Segetibacter sp.]
MEQLKLIKINTEGNLVRSWQFFLTGQGFFEGEVTGTFDAETKNATMAFQKKHNLQPDGIVGNKSFGMAMQLGFEGIIDDRTDRSGPEFPAKPPFPCLDGNDERRALFGNFSFEPKPIPGNPENIRITDDWQSKNITMTSIPQLIDIKGSDGVQFHKLAASQLIKLWKDWEEAELLNLVLTWAGSFVPRFVRGSKKTLSNHAFGTAFDINVAWNHLGSVPALVGQKGSVRELVKIANDNGFYWGGHFTRLDGMHFEIAKLM